MRTSPSVAVDDNGTNTCDFATLVSESRLLADLTCTYGWSAADRAAFVQGITAPLQGASDWRLQKISALDRQYAPNLMVGRGSTVLDAGSGAGSLVIAAQRSGINMVGVELDDASLELAGRLAVASGLGRDHLLSLFMRGDVARLPFRAESFAVITCHQVLEHTDTPDAALQEMLRCLRPGGLMWLDAPDYRFCYEPHYRIPWLPYMPKYLARHWLEAFDKPATGLSTFEYICLPQCVQMLEVLGVKVLHASTTTPLAQIDEQLRDLTGRTSQDCFPAHPKEVRALATRARNSDFRPEPTSFLVLARKPSGPVRT